MKVLIVSGNFQPLSKMSPSGAAYIAGAALKAGHMVEIFDCILADDLVGELKSKISQSRPDVIGISIIIVTSDLLDEKADYGTKYVDLRPKIKDIVDTIKQNSDIPKVLGGSGFNYFSEEWLDYLDLNYGIRGEGEKSFPLYLKNLSEGEEIYNVPGCVFKTDEQIHKVPQDHIKDFDTTAYPSYGLFDWNEYNELGIAFAVYSKRGCAFGCTFCPHSSLEGSRYRLKSPERVVSEIEHVIHTTKADTINFCDNSFNCPKKHAEAICEEIINRRLRIKWKSGAIKPLGISKDFCKLMQESGCEYVGLSIETASEKMLINMNRGYKVPDIKEALENLNQSGIPFGLSILIGAPGETPQTISETLDIIDQYPMVQSIWFSIGIYLWTHHQKVLEIARQEGQVRNEKELFDGAYYISPELPKDYMIQFIESLKKEGIVRFK